MKFVFVYAFASGLAGQAFGDDADPKAAIEAALLAGDAAAVGAILSEAPAELAPELESLSLEAARNAVRAGKLDTASSIAEAVLLFNLDNSEAQDLYTSVEEARRLKAAQEEKKRQEAEAARAKAEAEAAAKARAEAEAAKAEAEREAARAKAEADAKAAEEARLELERRAREAREADERKRAEEEAFLRSVRVIGWKNFTASAALSPALVDIGASSFADAYSGDAAVNSGYGFSGSAELRFHHPYVGAKLEASYGLVPFPFSEGDTSNSLSARLAIGTPAIGLPLYLSAGFVSRTYAGADGAEADTVLFTALSSPTLGIGIEDWAPLPNLELGLRAEWLAVSAVDDLIDFAASVRLSGKYYWRRGEAFDLFAGVAVGADGIFAGDGLEWSIHPSLEAGASIHAK